MRFLVVSPNQLTVPDPVPPLGAAYAAGIARAAGHEVALYDACFAGERMHGELAATIAEFRPQAIGMSLRNVDEASYPRALSALPRYREAVRTVRAAAPGVPLLLGGSAFTLFPEALLAALDADHGVAGEAETALPSLLERLARGAVRRGEIVQGTGSDLTDSALPARELLDLARYAREGGSVNVQTKRGCVFSCGYCTYPMLEGRRVRVRHPERVVDELEAIVQTRGIDSFFFVDSVFNVPREHARALCEAILRRGLSLRWTSYVTPAGLTAELVDAMARAGCRSVDLGTDAASAGTLAGMHKGFDAEDVRRASRLLREAGIAFCHSLIFGGPGETWSTLEETVAVVEETRPAAAVAMVGVRVYPGTRVAAHARAHGVEVDPLSLTPVHWIEPAVADRLLERLKELVARSPLWVVPGVSRDLPEPLRKRLRARGAQGPLWEQLGRGSRPLPGDSRT